MTACPFPVPFWQGFQKIIRLKFFLKPYIFGLEPGRGRYPFQRPTFTGLPLTPKDLHSRCQWYSVRVYNYISHTPSLCLPLRLNNDLHGVISFLNDSTEQSKREKQLTAISQENFPFLLQHLFIAI